jgi:cation transporter-like permease
MSPQIKQVLSGIALAIAGGALAALEHYAFGFGPLATIIATSTYSGIVHRIPALGTEQAVTEKLVGKVPS